MNLNNEGLFTKIPLCQHHPNSALDRCRTRSYGNARN